MQTHTSETATTIEELCEVLDGRYYQQLTDHCNKIRAIAVRLREREMQHATSIYSNLCLAFIEELRHYTQERIEKLIPYLKKLHAKTVEQHDCRNCTGWCGMGHSVQMLEIESSQTKIRELLYRLHKVALPILEESDFPEIYLSLRREMLSLEQTIVEMFAIEEGELVPIIKKAQKKIHAQD